MISGGQGSRGDCFEKKTVKQKILKHRIFQQGQSSVTLKILEDQRHIVLKKIVQMLYRND